MSSRTTTRVDFHCHSTHSDGFYGPANVAERLAEAGVRYAALTDHDSTDGLGAFEEAAQRLGMSCVTGVEISVGDDRDFMHVLAYGIDPEDSALQALLASNRARHLAGPVPHGIQSNGVPDFAPRETVSDDVVYRGRPWLRALAHVVQVIHEAHGRAFFAHPLSLTHDPEELDDLLGICKEVGLDGIEALYAGYSDVERRTLAYLAKNHGLLVCAGSDYHGPQRPGPLKPGMDMTVRQWKRFRDAVLDTDRPVRGDSSGVVAVEHKHAEPLQVGEFILRILFPALLAIGLFVVSIFAMIVPAFESHLMDRKRETIRELTNSAWSVLAEYERLERDGVLGAEEARKTARESMRGMRYGGEGKDYFWITDTQPRMVMHPYRTDLENTDVSDFTDPNGVRLFVEFARLVEADGEGYASYVWQWKDDPERLVPKESYVRGFEPWGWIIGTGIYVEDVNAEIRQLTAQVINVSALITIVIVLLLVYVIHQSLRIERQRREVVEDLDESHEKYRALVDAATEGTIMVLENKCTYSNTTAQEMLGYSPGEFALLDMHDLFPAPGKDDAPLAEPLGRIVRGHDTTTPVEARLRGKGGKFVDVVLTSTGVEFAGKRGFILNAKDISGAKQIEEALDVSRQKYRALTENLDIGVFRAELRDDGRLVEMNPAARKIFGLEDGDEVGAALRRLFHEADEAANFFATLRSEHTVRRTVVSLRRPDGDVSIVSLSAALSEDGDREEERAYFDGIFDDITERKRTEEERDNIIAELQTSLLFLNEPVRHFVLDLKSCAMSDSIEKVATQMTKESCSALAVRSGSGEVVGIVTDHDFRERVLVARHDVKRPVFEIMSAPLLSIPQRALVYEAILLMQERGVRHLAVRDEGGSVVSIVRSRDLMRFERYSAAVLTNEIDKARTVEDIAVSQRRLPVLVHALIDSGTRPRSVNRVITTITDTIVERLVALATEEIGLPPVPFAFIALGSEGRGEQTLVTDQDNAIIYEAPAGADGPGDEELGAYFLRLGTIVCDGLNTVGYHHCRGDLMAKNPKWCQPMSVWKDYFTRWVGVADPQDMLEINQFFDFRCVYGDREVVDRLRVHIRQAFHAQEPFFHHFAENALLSKPPLTSFGRIAVGGDASKPKTFNIKDAMMLVVTFSRLYALRHDVLETNTVDRLDRLRERNVISRTMHREIVHGYEYLMRMRLSHQARMTVEGLEPDNLIDPRGSTHIEESTLKQIFSQLSGAQNKIANDFSIRG